MVFPVFPTILQLQSVVKLRFSLLQSKTIRCGHPCWHNVFIDKLGDILGVCGLDSMSLNPSTEIIAHKHDKSISILSSRHMNDINSHFFPNEYAPCGVQKVPLVSFLLEVYILLMI